MDLYAHTDALRRVTPDGDLDAVLDLMRTSFAYLDTRIDPPSSIHKLTLETLTEAATRSEIWVIGETPQACIILTRRPASLYLSKLAVAKAARGQGLARRLVQHALERAREMGMPSVTLQTRVELTENQAAFARLGFEEMCRTAHPGYDRPTSITFERKV